jgi:hypothetical protein
MGFSRETVSGDRAAWSRAGADAERRGPRTERYATGDDDGEL